MSEATIHEKTAQRRVQEFERKYGQATLHLAYHAALPVVLNTQLLHLLRINFLFDQPEPLPYTAEINLLMSSLCQEVDDGLYEIEPNIRDVLLRGLIFEYGYERAYQIAGLLWQYTKNSNPWGDRDNLERSQQLTALNFLNPARAKQWLDEGEAYFGRYTVTQQEWFVTVRRELKRDETLLHSISLYSSTPTQALLPAKNIPKILYIEGDPVLRDVMAQLFKFKAEYEIEVAHNGLEGIEKAALWQPDLILTGLRMPIIDGYKAIEAIRNEPTTSYIPIIVISAWHSAKHKERALAVGANEHLTPPVDMPRLLKIIRRYIKYRLFPEEKLLMATLGERLDHRLSIEERKQLRELEELLLTDLTPREARILSLIFGFQNDRIYTLTEVAIKFGLTDETVRHLERQSLLKLRRSQKSKLLKNYLGPEDKNTIHSYLKEFKIPSDLYLQMWEILIGCDQFKDDVSFQSLFSHPKLADIGEPSFSGSTTDPTITYVEAIIDFLINRQNSRHENGLVLLFQVLSEQTKLGDEYHQRLLELSKKLANILQSDRGIWVEKKPGQILRDILQEFCDELDVDEMTEEGLDDIPAMVDYLVDYLENQLKEIASENWEIRGIRESYPMEVIVTLDGQVYPIFAEFSWWSTHNSVISSYLSRSEVLEAFVLLFSNNENVKILYSYQKPVHVFPIIFQSNSEDQDLSNH